MTFRGLCFALALLVTLLGLGHEAQAKGLELASGAQPLVLRAEPGGYAARVVLKNTSSEPAQVRVAPLSGSDADPRLPPDLRVQFADGGGSTALLAAGQSREVEVRWSVSDQTRAARLSGSLFAEVEGGERVAMEFSASRLPPHWFWDHALGWLTVLPLLGLLGVLGLSAARRFEPRRLAWPLWLVGAVQLVVVALLFNQFDRGLSRYDGNEGYQFLESSRLLVGFGVHQTFAVDGLSLLLLLLVPLLLLLQVARSGRENRQLPRYYALLLLTDTGLCGALAAADLTLFAVFFLMALAAAVSLAVLWSDTPKELARRVVPPALIVAALMLFVVVVLSRYAGVRPGLTHTSAFAELFHSQLNGVSLWGIPLPAVVVVALLGAAWLGGGLAPFQGWLQALTGRAPPAVCMGLWAASGLSLYALLRIGYGVVPGGVLWAAPAMGGMAAVSVGWASFSLFSARDLRRCVGGLAALQGGFIVLGLASVTAIGVQAAVAGLVARGLFALAGFAVVDLLAARLHELRADHLSGLSAEQRWLAGFLAMALAAGVGLPGTLVGMCQMAGVVGLVPTRPWLGALILLSWLPALLAVAHICAGFARGRLADELRASPELAAHGGHLAPLNRRELALGVGVLALSVLPAVWPASILGVSGAAAQDAVSRVVPPGPTEISAGPLPAGQRLSLR